MEIIPAIDIIDGKCVRLTKGDFAAKTVYNEDPLEVALAFEAAGMNRLHLVDLDGAKAGAVKNWKVLEKIASRTRLVIDFSGGINNKASVDICFNSGRVLLQLEAWRSMMNLKCRGGYWFMARTALSLVPMCVMT